MNVSLKSFYNAKIKLIKYGKHRKKQQSTLKGEKTQHSPFLLKVTFMFFCFEKMNLEEKKSFQISVT